MAKDDTKHLVFEPKISSQRSTKIVKICAAIAVCVTFVVGTLIVFTRDENSVSERESEKQEVASRSMESIGVESTPFEAIPGLTCGVHFNPQGNSSSNRVIGGHPAVLGMFRWQASFKDILPYEDGYCGASIISDRWLLTAAHCITGSAISNPENLFVRVGSLSKVEGGVKHYLERVVINEDYRGNVVRGNDVALLKTKTVIILNDFVHPVCLPPRDLCLASGSEMWISGYGFSEEEDENAMFYAKTELTNFEDCKRSFDPDLSESVTCTRATPTTCNGDSGGPLSTRINEVWYNYGSVSLQPGLCPANASNGFSRTTYFI